MKEKGIYKMKSKIKITRHPEDNSTLVNYFKHKNATAFRYSLFNQILKESKENIVLILDTNRKINELEIEKIEARLKEENIIFLKSPIKAIKRKFFGLQFLNFKKNKAEKPAYVLFVELTNEQFTESLFTEILSMYDLGIGLGKKKDLSEIQSLYLVDFNHVMFNQEVFENTIYDSVIFSQLRSSIEISSIVEKIE